MGCMKDPEMARLSCVIQVAQEIPRVLIRGRQEGWRQRRRWDDGNRIRVPWCREPRNAGARQSRKRPRESLPPASRRNSQPC